VDVLLTVSIANTFWWRLNAFFIAEAAPRSQIERATDFENGEAYMCIELTMRVSFLKFGLHVRI
jgi:hypothetical protein